MKKLKNPTPVPVKKKPKKVKKAPHIPDRDDTRFFKRMEKLHKFSVANIYTFYSLELIWFSMNNLNQHFARDEDIRRFEIEFTRFLKNLKKHLLDIVSYSCYCEVRHVKTASKYNSLIKKEPNFFTRKEKNIIDEIKSVSRLSSVYHIKKRFNYNHVEAMSFCKKAFDPKVDWDYHYGGNAWLNGVEAWFKLKEAESLEDMCLWIDRVFDLQHNNGVLFDKHPIYETNISDVKVALDDKRYATDLTGLLYRTTVKGIFGYRRGKYRGNLYYRPLINRYKKFCIDKSNSREYSYEV